MPICSIILAFFNEISMILCDMFTTLIRRYSKIGAINLLVSPMVIAVGCTRKADHDSLKQEIAELVKTSDAEIGVAVIINGSDTVSINGNQPFPMLSVYKFPIALGVGEYCRAGGFGFGDSCLITRDELHTDTWSPMSKIFTADSTSITIRELLDYAIRQSDNNASDILLHLIGGTAQLDNHIEYTNGDGIEIRWTEDEMHKDVGLSYENTSTPIAMARLLDNFYTACGDSLSLEIKYLMEHCETGKDRLAKPLPSGVTIGHKTGTGDINSQGRIIAVNDVGYVVLPDGRHYVIAVFIKDSAYDMSETSELIAAISSKVYSYISQSIQSTKSTKS